MNAKQVIKILEADGWALKKQSGSHKQYEHATRKGKVTVPAHAKKDIAPKTLSSIWKQADIK